MAGRSDAERWAEYEADLRHASDHGWPAWKRSMCSSRTTHIAAAQATLDHFGLTLPPEPSPAEMIARAFWSALGWSPRAPDDIAPAFAALLEDGTLKAAVDAYEAGGGS